jgi:hypothetical protein
MLTRPRWLRLGLGLALGLGISLAAGCTAFGSGEDGAPQTPPVGAEAGGDAGAGDDASTADGSTADGTTADAGCTGLPFADGFEADVADSGWNDIFGGADLERVTELKYAGSSSLRVTVLPSDNGGFRRSLERQVAPDGCEPPSRLEMRLHIWVTEIAGDQANKGVRFLSLEFATTRVFVKLEPGPRIVVREQEGGNPASLLADLPLTLETWTEVRLSFDSSPGAASQAIAFGFGGSAIEIPPPALAHERPQRIVLGAAYVDNTARARFYIDGFEAQ